MRAIVARSVTETAIAVAGAWLAFMAALLVGREVEDVASFAFAGAGGAILVLLGFAAASRCRRLPRRSMLQRARLGLASFAAGTGLGLANLGANWLVAEADPRLRALLTERMTVLEALDAVVVSPIVEEVAVRLFLMSVMAWLVFRITHHAGLAFAIALVGSAVFFALLHLNRPLPDEPLLANYYRAALVVKYMMAGVPLGWIFWRWGLPYATVGHAAANAAHLALQERIF